MKRIIGMAGLCLVAVFAFSAVAASGASAADLLFKLPAGQSFPLLLAGLDENLSFLETANKSTIECNKAHIHVLIEDAHLGKIHVLWLECQNKILGTEPCWSAGEGRGKTLPDILFSGTFHLGLAHLGTETKIPAVLVLVPAGFEVICDVLGGEQKIPVTGNVIGKIENEVNKQLASTTISFNKGSTAGSQELTEFLLSKLSNEELMTGQFLESTVLGKKEHSNEQAKGTLSKGTETVELELKV